MSVCLSVHSCKQSISRKYARFVVEVLQTTHFLMKIVPDLDLARIHSLYPTPPLFSGYYDFVHLSVMVLYITPYFSARF